MYIPRLRRMVLPLWDMCTSDLMRNIDQRSPATTIASYCRKSYSVLDNWMDPGNYACNLRIYSTAEFIRSKCGYSPWIALPGFAVERIWEDWLHLVDLAIAPDACASDWNSDSWKPIVSRGGV